MSSRQVVRLDTQRLGLRAHQPKKKCNGYVSHTRSHKSRRRRGQKVWMSFTPPPTTRLANGQPAITRPVAAWACEEARYCSQPRTTYQIRICLNILCDLRCYLNMLCTNCDDVDEDKYVKICSSVTIIARRSPKRSGAWVQAMIKREAYAGNRPHSSGLSAREICSTAGKAVSYGLSPCLLLQTNIYIYKCIYIYIHMHMHKSPPV